MYRNITNNIFNIVTVITVTMFFSCSNNFNAVKEIGVSENEPIGVAENINLKYTDSGKIKAILISSKMLDFRNRSFPFNEFPEGITLDIFDNKNQKNVVVADYAIVYSNTGLIDLQGNVVITTHNGDILKTEQLYFDQDKKWLFSNYPTVLNYGDGSIGKGNVFDANTDFSLVNIYEMHDSVMVLEE